MARTFDEIIKSAGTRSFDELIAEPFPILETEPKSRSFEEIIGEGEMEPIGLIEAAKERPLEKIPFSPLGAIETMGLVQASKRLSRNKYDTSMFLPEQKGLLPSDIAYVSPERRPAYLRKQKEFDIQIITEYLEELDKKQRRGYTTMGRVGQITSEMPAFMTEFILTGGLKAIGTKSAQRAGRKMLGKYASTTAGKAALATGGFAIGTAARAAGMPHRAANAILKRQVPQDMKISDDGEVEIIGPVEKPFTSLWKGLGDHWIEIASEEAGAVIAPFVSKYFAKMPMMGKLTGALQRRWLAKYPGKTASDFTKKILKPGGFHGIIGEVGEEYLGDITRAITDIDDFGANAVAQEKYGRDAGMLERVVAGVEQDNENLLPMLISFSIPGAIGKGADIVSQKQATVFQERQREMDLIIGAEINTPTQIETAEGTVGFEDDFFMEKWVEKQPKYKFEIPGVSKFFTPKWLLNRLLGAEILLEDVNKAQLAMGLEKIDINSWINRLIPKIKGEKDLARLPDILPGIVEKVKESEIVPAWIKTMEEEIAIDKAEAAAELMDVSVAEHKKLIGDIRNRRIANEYEQTQILERADVTKIKAHILQTKIGKDTNPVNIMRDLLDTYEDAPTFLTKSEAHIFNQVRELTRYLRQRANMVRKKMGLEPIADVKGYITHWLDSTANKVVSKDLPIHSGYLYWLMKGLPKEVKNPTAMRRKIKQDMQSYFSKDLGKLLKTMTAYDLRDIYLSEPYQAAWDELQQLREKRLIPDSTYKEIENYLLYDIRKHQAPMHKAFNKTIKKPVDLLNKLLPVKNIIDDPARSIFSRVRRWGHISGLGLRARPLTRNLGQRLLLTDLYRTVDYAKAQAVAFGLADMPIVKHPITGKEMPLIELIREQNWYRAAIRKFEDVVTDIGRIEKAPLYLYGKTHIGNLFLSNVEVSAIAGYFDWQQMRAKSKDVRSKHFKNAVKHAKKIRVPVSELLTQESDMIWNMREAVRRTQWEYFSISMPTFYRSQFNRAIGMFQSWWMNYFFNHSREMINQSVTGRNSLGRLLTPGGRLRAAKGMGTIVAIGKASKTLFGIEMLKYLLIPLPSFLPPIPELVVGIIQFFAADDEKARARAWKRVKYGLRFWTPLSAFRRDLNKLLSGEYSIGDFLFYRTEKE